MISLVTTHLQQVTDAYRSYKLGLWLQSHSLAEESYQYWTPSFKLNLDQKSCLSAP